MPQVGLKYLVGAKYAESNDSATYTAGAVLSPITKADVSVEYNEATFYANDELRESEKAFKQGTLSLGVDTLDYSVCNMLFGQTAAEKGDSAPATLTAKTTDQPSNIGVGFYAKVLRSGVASFRAMWLPKVLFKPGADSFETKGDGINFLAPTIEGTIMSDVNGAWKVEAMCESEEAAKTWLNTKAGITE